MWCVLGRGLFFSENSPGTSNNVLFCVFRVLQGQLRPGVGYIDADRKVSMTKTGLISNLCAKVQESVKHVPKQCISIGFGKVKKSSFLTAGL